MEQQGKTYTGCRKYIASLQGVSRPNAKSCLAALLALLIFLPIPSFAVTGDIFEMVEQTGYICKNYANYAQIDLDENGVDDILVQIKTTYGKAGMTFDSRYLLSSYTCGLLDDGHSGVQIKFIDLTVSDRQDPSTWVYTTVPRVQFMVTPGGIPYQPDTGATVTISGGYQSHKWIGPATSITEDNWHIYDSGNATNVSTITVRDAMFLDDLIIFDCYDFTDSDLDGFALEAGTCASTDCNDSLYRTNPMAAEICLDGNDNDCDGEVDESDCMRISGSTVLDYSSCLMWTRDPYHINTNDIDGGVEAYLQYLEIGGLTGWRLPKVTTPDDTCSGPDSTGFECLESELGHLFYSSLKNTGKRHIKSLYPFNFPDYVPSSKTWVTGTRVEADPSLFYVFDFFRGRQFVAQGYAYSGSPVWPVRDASSQEICDGLDNDCNGQVDDGFTTVPEVCDGLDNDCDGQIDEGLSTDSDGDGHYAPGSCLMPDDDCDDNNPEIWDCNTPVGDDVSVQDDTGTVEVTYDEVIAGGDTTITVEECQAEPEGIFLPATDPLCVHIEISDTLEFGGDAQVCIPYDDTGMTLPEEQNLRMVSCDKRGSCEVIALCTGQVDTVNNKVCGCTEHLSMFTVGTLIDTDGDFVPDLLDNCQYVQNWFQEDADEDGIGDACDNCPNFHDPTNICADACMGDFDNDGDVDGSDLAVFAAGGTGITLEEFSTDFGKTNCP